jgi:ELWxxDGT repeat protein
MSLGSKRGRGLARRFGCERLEDRRLLAGGIELVRDLNLAGPGGEPAEFVEVGDLVYFVATSDTLGRELWVSDGTPEGTRVAFDIRPDATSSDPANLTVVGDDVYFAARSPQGTSALYRTSDDGQEAVLLLRLPPPSGSSTSQPSLDLRGLTNVAGTLYFAAADTANSRQLWRSDGTAAGTLAVRAGERTSIGVISSSLTNVGGRLFFTSDELIGSPLGDELWTVAPGSAGATLVKDLRPGEASSSPRFLANTGGLLLFYANDGIHGEELWRSDGTAEGTVFVRDVRPGPLGSTPLGDGIGRRVVVGERLFFSADDGVSGDELWVTDGSSNGTRRVADIAQGTGSSPAQMIRVGESILFVALQPETGFELWRTDGTNTGTALVKELGDGLASANLTNLIEHEGLGYFFANFGRELWKTDGTDSGTTRVATFPTRRSTDSASRLTSIGGALLFRGTDGELWRSDGTTAGTGRIVDLRPSTLSSNPANLVNVDGRLYFSANDGSTTRVAHSRGTAGSIELIGKPATLANPSGFTAVSGRVFYTIDGELWVNDGSPDSARLVKAFALTGRGDGPTELVNVNGTLFFAASSLSSNGASGIELWKSDGTEAGTVQVKDIRPGVGSSYPTQLTNVEGVLYFAATEVAVGRLSAGETSGTGSELWRSDGTEAGTRRVLTVTPGLASAAPSRLTNVDGVLYFRANDPQGGSLWRTDGTAEGTVRLKQGNVPFVPGIAPVRGLIASVGSTHYFVTGGTQRGELWSTDGTPEGTRVVIPQTPTPSPPLGPGPIDSLTMTNVNGRLLFFDSLSRLWTTDGTQEGTSLLALLGPSQTRSVVATNGRLYFTASNQLTASNLLSTGVELWVSDGTAAGTRIVGDLNPGPEGSNPANLTVVGDRLLFTATTPQLGTELYRLSLVDPPALEGDFDRNGLVDRHDYIRWVDDYVSQTGLRSDGNGDGEVNLADYTVWRDNLGRRFAAPSAITAGPLATNPAVIDEALAALLVKDDEE